MKIFLLFTVLLIPALHATNIGNDEETFVEAHVGPRLKYYDSDGVEMIIPLGNNHHRSIRELAACSYPVNSTNFYLDCKIYPNRITCTQTCLFGTTLSTGIQREMMCMFDEDVWTPTDIFEECKPFIDCTLDLTPGGKYKCYTNDLTTGTYCVIYCARIEDEEAVSENRYACDIDGDWRPQLPRCAKAGTGLDLVPPPKGQKSISGY